MADMRVVVGGVDTHKDLHVAAAVDEQGRVLGVSEWETTRSGYRGLLDWLLSFGSCVKVGVEGTGSYGAGLTRYLRSQDIQVLEVNRPNRQTRRLRGKSDTVDAEAAARAVLAGQARVTPKSQDGIVESIRAIRIAFVSARRARAKVANQIRDLLVSAPEGLRSALQGLEGDERVKRLAAMRPSGDPADPLQGTKLALRSLARTYQTLNTEIEQLRSMLDELTARANPALSGAHGVGSDAAAILLIAAGDNPQRLKNESSFAALCGVSPVQASSGKTHRHRLNRGGNRQANHALWRIATIRLLTDPDTKRYAKRRSEEGKSRREIVRCLKRHIAREIFKHLTNPQPVPDGAQLRAARQRAKISLQTLATQTKSWPIRISELERGLRHDTRLARQCQALLNQT
jgi:transposase